MEPITLAEAARIAEAARRFLAAWDKALTTLEAAKEREARECFCSYEPTPAMCPAHGA